MPLQDANATPSFGGFRLKILRDAYHLGSKAVHASRFESSEETRKLLTDAQELCRKGILKRLDEDERPNWNELILGKEN